jgi:hypothetical protein
MQKVTGSTPVTSTKAGLGVRLFSFYQFPAVFCHRCKYNTPKTGHYVKSSITHLFKV